MTRKELLQSREYWLTKIQLDLFELIENYRKENHLNKTQLAERLGVTKGYISQILNGDFDHKISKLVDLSLSFGKVPEIRFTSVEQYNKDEISSSSFSASELVIKPKKPKRKKQRQNHNKTTA